MGLRSFRQMDNDQIEKIKLLSYQTRIRNKLDFYSKENTWVASFLIPLG